jgi:hypothetical protein
VGERVSAVEPRLLEEPAQAPAYIRLGDPRGPPQLLADVVEAQRSSRALAGKNETAVLDRRGTDHAAALANAPQLRHNALGVGERLKHRVAKNRIKHRVAKRQLTAVGQNASEVVKSD